MEADWRLTGASCGTRHIPAPCAEIACAISCSVYLRAFDESMLWGVKVLKCPKSVPSHIQLGLHVASTLQQLSGAEQRAAAARALQSEARLAKGSAVQSSSV